MKQKETKKKKKSFESGFEIKMKTWREAWKKVKVWGKSREFENRILEVQVKKRMKVVKEIHKGFRRFLYKKEKFSFSHF